MTSRLLNFNQILPVAPLQYTPESQAALTRAIYNLQQNLQNPGEMRGTKVTLTDLPTSDQGLEVGALYRLGNQVFIALGDVVSPPGLFATGSVGSVTIAIT
jgi:hypothetical protein|tara:strand:+ start:1299 stop:1601 length:303 start_codon:yes stop_codon:yes gene_type:complete